MHGRRFLLPLGATALLGACVVVYESRVLLQLSARPDPDADRDFRFPGERTHLIPTSDGGELYVEECGAGRPVLLLHGHGASMRTFSLMAAPLAAGGCRVHRDGPTGIRSFLACAADVRLSWPRR